MIKNYIEKLASNPKISKQEIIWLLEHICQEKYVSLAHKTLTFEQEQLFKNYLDQIITENKPLAYIIGWVPFLDLKINIHPPILIPRPETEEWVHQLIEKLSVHKGLIKKILDIGTGSGAIALSLAKAFPDTQIIAIDINPKALILAQENAKINHIQNVTFIESDLFEKLENQEFDLIVSNPPYIPEKMQPLLASSVTQWEDPKALFSGEKGLDLIKKIITKSSNHLTLNQDLPFQLVIEIDITHYDLIEKLAQENHFNCFLQKDLFGNWRTIWCKKTQKMLS